jgi:nucleoside-diphosphate-sugar epimerase
MICSSSEVYGNVEKKYMPISEKQIIAPINPYAGTKAFQDIISQIYYKSFGLKIIITRMFSYTNPRRSDLFQTSFARQISLIEKGKKNLLTHGNLKSVRTFIDIEDAMEAYWVAATKGKIGEIYNIGGNKVISVNNFLKRLLKLSKVKINTKVNKKLLRPRDINIQLVNSEKFFKDTGWKPKIKFDYSVKKLLDDCRKLY